MVSTVLQLASVALAVSSSVYARTGALGPTNNYIAPSGSQIGTINQTIICSATLSGLSVIPNATFTITLGGALTNSVNRTQSFYLTGRAIVTGSLNYTGRLKNLGVTSIAGVLNKTIITTPGAAASGYDVTAGRGKPITIANQSIVAGKQIVINIPATTEAPLVIGPIKANATAAQILTAVGLAVVNINATLHGARVPIVITCPATNPPSYLAFVTVGGSGATTVAKTGDYPPIKTLPANSVIGSAGFQYNCKVDGVTGNISVPVSLTTFGGLSVKKGAKFQYLNSHGTINITQTAVAKLKATLPAASQTALNKFQLTVKTLTITGTGINPKTVPALASAITSDIVTLNSTSTYQVSIPGKNGLLPPINFTAQATPGIALAFLGNTVVTITALRSNGSTLKAFNVNCAAPSPSVPLLPLAIVN